MLAWWLGGFILGTITARSLGGFIWLASDLPGMIAIPLTLIIVSRIPRLASAVSFIVGLSWGLSHAASYPSGTLNAARVIRSTAVHQQMGSALIEHQSRVLEIRSALPVDSTATVFCKSAPGIFGNRICFTANRTHLVASSPPDSIDRKGHGFALSIIWGDRKSLDRTLIQLFKDLGLFHLLVVSGMHVTLLALFAGKLVLLPFQIAYGLRLIGPKYWPNTYCAVNLLQIVTVVLYSYQTGLSQAAQRAMLLFVVLKVFTVFFGSVPLHRRLLVAAFLQTLIYPLGFIHEATLLSWTAYLYVIQFTSKHSGWFAGACGALKMQTDIAIWVAVCFGQLSLIGILANPLFAGLFLPVMLASLVLIGPNVHPLLTNFAQGFIDSFLSLLELCQELTQFPFLSWLTLDLSHNYYIRAMLCIYATISLLRVIARVR